MLALLAVVAYGAWASTPAKAHAELLRSNPPSNAVLDQSPSQVELFFTETLQTGLSTLSVLNSSGRDVDLADVQIDPNDPSHITVSVATLPDGVYTVAWSVISKVDGHPTAGSFPFAVGAENTEAVAAEAATSSSQLPGLGLVAKWLLYLSLAILVGQFSFATIVWKPAVGTIVGTQASALQELPGTKTLLEWGMVALLAGLGLSMLVQLGQTTGSELGAPWSSNAVQLVLGTRLGVIWLARVGLALAAAWFLKSRPAVWKPWAGFAVELAILLSLSLTAHAATESHPAVPVLADWLHLIGASFWLGGLPFFYLGLQVVRGLDGSLQARLGTAFVSRFSTMAMMSVGAIAATGLYSAYQRVGTLDALTTTSYGRTLLVKQFLVAGLLALAAVNRLWLSPRLRPRTGERRRLDAIFDLQYTVRAEMVLGVLLLVSVSLLTYLPPARAALPFEIQQAGHARDLQMTLDIVPGTLGNNTFTVHLSSGGQPVQSVETALLRFNALDHDVPQFDGPLQAVGNGDYTAQGNYLSLSGRWQVLVVVRRQNMFDAIAYFHFALPASERNDQADLARLAWGLLALDGILAALALSAVMRKVLLPRATQRKTPR